MNPNGRKKAVPQTSAVVSGLADRKAIAAIDRLWMMARRHGGDVAGLIGDVRYMLLLCGNIENLQAMFDGVIEYLEGKQKGEEQEKIKFIQKNEQKKARRYTRYDVRTCVLCGAKKRLMDMMLVDHIVYANRTIYSYKCRQCNIPHDSSK